MSSLRASRRLGHRGGGQSHWGCRITWLLLAASAETDPWVQAKPDGGHLGPLLKGQPSCPGLRRPAVGLVEGLGVCLQRLEKHSSDLRGQRQEEEGLASGTREGALRASALGPATGTFFSLALSLFLTTRRERRRGRQGKTGRKERGQEGEPDRGRRTSPLSLGLQGLLSAGAKRS